MKYNNKTRTRKKNKKTFKKRKRKTRKNNHKRVWNGGVGGLAGIEQQKSDFNLGQFHAEEEAAALAAERNSREKQIRVANQRIIDKENRGVLLHLALQARSPEGITWRDLLYPFWPPSNLLTKPPPLPPVRKMSDDEAYYNEMANRHEAMANEAMANEAMANKALYVREDGESGPQP